MTTARIPRAPVSGACLLIQRRVAEVYGITVEQLVGDRRQASLAIPRKVAILLALELTSLSTTVIGRAFRRDHSSIVVAGRNARELLRKDAQVAAQVEQLRRELADLARREALEQLGLDEVERVVDATLKRARVEFDRTVLRVRGALMEAASRDPLGVLRELDQLADALTTSQPQRSAA